MKEKLIIKNFGPIKSVELELGRFNVLIGEQATGKSTVAKVLAVCRYFSYIALDDFGFYAGQTKFSAGLSEWGLNDAIRKDSYIFYECDNYTVAVEQKKVQARSNLPDETGKYEKYETFSFLPELKPLSEGFKKLLKELNKVLSVPRNGNHLNPINRVIPTSFFLNDVAIVMDNPFYLPTERGLQSIFSLGKDSIGNISDSLFNQFAALDRIARFFKDDTLIEPLNITYKNVNGRGYIKSKKHDFLSLFNAASGYQSTIPVVLLIKYYSEIKRKKKTFIIEEPELNLFPTAQNELMKFLAENVKNHNEILLTTHSPYILTSLNNLMYAYQTGQEHREEVDKIIPEKFWVNPEDVSAYLLKYDEEVNGVVQESILDKEGLIMADKIDSVSAILNKDFNAMMDIELNVSK